MVDFKVRLTFFINEKLCHVGLYRVVHKSHTVFSFITSMVTSTDTNIAIADEMTLTGRKSLRVKRFSDYDTG